jgi:2-polyprenyl-3-methyl-5-hydroxy-6-metoxy-1,4-benzoquinol methylase
VSLATRDTRLTELMDVPGCDPVRLRRTLDRFRIVNRLVAGWDAVYRAYLHPALLAAGGSGRILDIGCGGGDVLRRIVQLARRDGYTMTGLGIDPDPRAIRAAQAAPEMPGVIYRHTDSGRLVSEGHRFDVVISNHLLHHLAADARAGVLADSERLATGLVVHADIARSRTAYAAYAIAITPIAPGSLLRTDGLRSIRRSYTPAELAAVLPEGWTAERSRPFRVLAIHRPAMP